MKPCDQAFPEGPRHQGRRRRRSVTLEAHRPLAAAPDDERLARRPLRAPADADAAIRPGQDRPVRVARAYRRLAQRPVPAHTSSPRLPRRRHRRPAEAEEQRSGTWSPAGDSPSVARPVAGLFRHARTTDRPTASAASPAPRASAARARPGVPAATALSGTSLVTTVRAPIQRFADRHPAQQTGAVADPAVGADAHVALVDALVADRGARPRRRRGRSRSASRGRRSRSKFDRDVLQLVACTPGRARSSRRSDAPSWGGSWCRAESSTSGQLDARRGADLELRRRARRSTGPSVFRRLPQRSFSHRPGG